MSDQFRNPNSDLGIIALNSCTDIAKLVDKTIVESRRARGENFDRNGEEVTSYLIPVEQTRFQNGEGKIRLSQTVRGKNIYILADVSNYGVTYKMYGKEVNMGPDEHLQDIKRVLSAMNGRANKVTVVMPLLYASRQHKKKARESLDCAMALQDLEKLGVDEIVTFDAHDPTIQNAIPLVSFLNIYPTLDILKHFLTTENWLFDPKEKLVVISPDTGAMDRAIYYANVLGLDIGLFYKRRDHSRIVNGKNPIVQHEYIGRDIKGMNVLIVDDMIASGGSVFDVAAELRVRGAKKIFVASTFAFFTEGRGKFDEKYEQGIIDKVFSTNLNFVPEEIKAAEWFSQADLSTYMAMFIDTLAQEKSVSKLLDATSGIRSFLLEHGFDPDARLRDEALKENVEALANKAK
ncbi:ribose-phosphate pyrophosphokinase [Proteiniclasticum sp. QWL-01]|uniref:ribose-phosphate pyrophosphokinase n=1 Tax=Proteiniclasticum sp. QWL-01 TaxID=3036945 RepID=UPI0024114649|nr:ribose-phosphate pyrophosphokinase [Proteiniclasticum sp. QWL-01]WFF74431.1 ribose-phosphate pyrophosphokinase [Proteiniclasticum sp. QWL-01]